MTQIGRSHKAGIQVVRICLNQGCQRISGALPILFFHQIKQERQDMGGLRALGEPPIRSYEFLAKMLKDVGIYVLINAGVLPFV